MATLLSLNVGMPKDVAWQGRAVHTGIWKQPVSGTRFVRRLNIDGDGQGDTKGHGGENRAVLVYQIESYTYWQKHFGRDDFTYGQFGENLTVDGLPDDEVCIGDRYRIGAAEFEVTQPRVTCYRVGIRLGEPDMPALLVSHHRPGFYMRVITEGLVQAGDNIVKTMDGPGQLSVADIDALLYLPGHDPSLLRQALDIPALSQGWRGSFEDLLAASERPDTDAPAAPAWAGFRRLKVLDTVVESTTVCSIILAAADDGPLPAALPGQYLTLRIAAAAPGSPAPVRNYSLSSAPGSATYRISVKRETHGLVSGYLHAQLRRGAVLDVGAPRGEFVLIDHRSPVLLLSAGVGVTPVLAMLHQLAEQRSNREIWWLHVTRGPAEHALADEAHALLAGLAHSHEQIFYTAATADELAATPAATGGRPSGAVLAELGIPSTVEAYICGPAGFMSGMRQALLELGVTTGNIRTELFGATPASTPGIAAGPVVAPHPPAGAPGVGPLVTFARSGLSVPWDDAGSLLELAEACDVATRWSCRTGVCHTCVTALLSGEVRYAPTPLEPTAVGEVLICCSRPASDLVLDL